MRRRSDPRRRAATRALTARRAPSRRRMAASRALPLPPPQRLLLMRHAKSCWRNVALRDHERPLAPRGERACAAVGAALFHRGWLPTSVHSSDAVRTRQTWELLAAAMDSTRGDANLREALSALELGTDYEVLPALACQWEASTVPVEWSRQIYDAATGGASTTALASTIA
jgi:hypothetical protein